MVIKKPGEGFRGVEGHIGYLLRQASHVIRLKIDRSLQQYAITHPQFAVLNVIELEPGLHAADIARVCMLSRQAVKTIVGNLEKAKLVRMTAHEIHGRVIEIFLTDLGKKRLNQCLLLIKKIETSMLSGLTVNEEKIVREWLVRCAST
jgi:DNA-binding MarR family transcriptional regulator